MIAIEQVEVGGTPVAARHVRVTTKLTGGESGSSAADYWFSVDRFILVKNTGSLSTDASGTFGNQHYSENYDLLLRSLTPAQ
jgi:hypothetical protein